MRSYASRHDVPADNLEAAEGRLDRPLPTQRAGGHYILGEKLRSDSKEAQAALARQGRDHTVVGNLRVKEVVIDEGTMRELAYLGGGPAPRRRRVSAVSYPLRSQGRAFPHECGHDVPAVAARDEGHREVPEGGNRRTTGVVWAG